jgi:uroporphyrinogen-III synthase
VSVRRGPRALVGRPDGQAAPLLAALAEAGIDAAHVPAIEIEAATAGGELDAAVRDARGGAWIAVTSGNAIEPVLDALRAAGRVVTDFRWAAVGTATAERLGLRGVADPFLPSRPDGAMLADELPVVPGDDVLLARGDLAEPGPVETLRGRGANVREVVAYRTVEAPPASRPRLAAILDDGPVDALVVTSGSIARGLAGLAEGPARARLLATPVVAAGAKAAEAARAAGFATVMTAPAPDTASLAAFTARALGLAPPALPVDVEPGRGGRAPSPLEPGG